MFAALGQGPQLPSSPTTSPMPPPMPLPPFLQLPADIVLYLSRNHLPPASAMALSLTCKALFSLVFLGAKESMNPSERQDLQLLLEKDLGHGWWYCHGCSRLRPITTRGPTCGINGHHMKFTRNSACRCHNTRWFDGSGFSVDYQSVHLAINRHFLGPLNGLPIEIFSVEPTLTGPLPWQEKWSARIVQDELFLSATRTLNGSGWSEEALRAALDYESREICDHIRTSVGLVFADSPFVKCPLGRSIYTPAGPSFDGFNKALLRPSMIPTVVFVPCHNVVESCGWCLTDYVTTVEKRLADTETQGCGKEQPTAYWFITITSYHQLGSGRSPTDPKWEAFGKCFTTATNVTRRDMAASPLGAVRDRWESA